MAVLTRGKRRPGNATTTQINAIATAGLEKGSLLGDQTIDKFKYWNGAIWKPLPVDVGPSYGEKELANDVDVTVAEVVCDTYEITDSGIFVVQASCFVKFGVAGSISQITDLELWRDGSPTAKVWVSQARGGNYVVHGTVMAHVSAPCTVTLVSNTLHEVDVVTLKSYANNGTIAHWHRIGT